MRVIAGVYRSRQLTGPTGMATRPTSDRLRETLFNVLAQRIAGSTFADLYAGSGANGIEAISRGAAHVFFIENAAPAIVAIRSNLKSLGIESGFSIEPRKVSAFLRKFAEANTKTSENSAALAAKHEAAKEGPSKHHAAGLGIVFLDPPYADRKEYEITLSLLGGECAAVLAPGANVVAEHLHRHPLAEAYGALSRTRVLRQGDAALSFFALQTD